MALNEGPDNVKDKKSKAKIHSDELDRFSSGGASDDELEQLAKMVDDLDKDTEKLLMTKDNYKYLSGEKLKEFSYQKKAVRDLIFKFRRKGILSDQVGMGKTIEAGMIISELAARRELDSLLILVPSSNMVYKWEKELSQKFGFKNIYEDVKHEGGKVIKVEDLPKITDVQSMADIDALIMEAVDDLNNDDTVEALSTEALKYVDCDIMRGINLNRLIIESARNNHADITRDIDLLSYAQKYDEESGAKTLYQKIIPEFIKRIAVDINKKFVDISGLDKSKYDAIIAANTIGGTVDAEAILKSNLVNGVLKSGKLILPPISFDEYKKYRTDFPIAENDAYSLIIDHYSACYDGVEYYKACSSISVISNSIIREFNFYKAKLGKVIREIISKSFPLMNYNEKRLRLCEIATAIKNRSSVLIINNEKVNNEFLLGTVLYNVTEHATSYMCGEAISDRQYSVFDMLIDMRYTTLIVDEAHNYIDVSHKYSQSGGIPQGDVIWSNYHLFELFYTHVPKNYEKSKQAEFDRDCERDKYLVKRNCLYAKLLTLAGRANRKIFMTATPIKSDMIDFYLLTLLKGEHFNVDPTIYGKDENGVLYINHEKLNDTVKRGIMERLNKHSTPQYVLNHITEQDFFCLVVSSLFRTLNQAAEGRKALKQEEKVLAKKLILRQIQALPENANELWDGCEPNKLLKVEEYKSVKNFTTFFESLKACVNTAQVADAIKAIATAARYDFEDNFTIEDGKTSQIKTIQELVSSEEGLERWRDMYNRLGIRSTRHQTNMIPKTWLYLFTNDSSEKGSDSSSGRMDASYYTNLPVWSRRNGAVLYIMRKDRYFDYVVRERMETFLNGLSQTVVSEKPHFAYDSNKETAVAQSIDAEKKSLKDNSDLSEMERQSRLGDFMHTIWSDSYNDYSKDVQKISNVYNTLNKAKMDAECAYRMRKMKKTIAEFLFKYVLDDGMKGDELKQEDYEVYGFPNFFDGRLHMLQSLILKEMDKDASFDNNSKVLVFANDDINEMLYQELCKAQKTKEWNGYSLDTEDGKEAYSNVYGHTPLYGHADSWVISNRVEDLSKRDNIGKKVLVVVPPNKYEEGIDLQMATHLINFDILHSPLLMEQRIGRIDRVKENNSIDDHDIYIYAFTPLNDWSGFSTVFLAKYLNLFSQWNGDTTGIVSFPIGTSENSATFNDIVKKIEDSYKILSDHVGGQDVVDIFSSLDKIENSDDKFKYASIKKQLNKLRFKYDGKTYLGNEANGTEKKLEKNLKDHIDEQANRLLGLLNELSKINKMIIPTNGKTTDNSLKVPSKNEIIADLSYLYHQHFYMDLVANNMKLNEREGKYYFNTSIVSDKTRNRKINIYSIIKKAITGYFNNNEFFDKSSWPSVASGGGYSPGMSKRIDDNDETPVEELIKSYVQCRDEFGAKANVITTDNPPSDVVIDKNSSQAKSVDIVFSQYRTIINKYLDILLVPYKNLCEQVKKRLNEMASIIKDGTVVDLIYAINVNEEKFSQ